VEIIALHGFLGEKKDFGLLNLPIFVPRLRPKAQNFKDWADDFNRSFNYEILLGYSLGGRLALYCLLRKKYKAAIIIAAHPGLKEPMRAQRLLFDKLWAQRFLKDPWDKLMKDWNGQEIFKQQEIFRDEKNFNRKELSLWLDRFSLGRQEHLISEINLLTIPILWIQPESEKDKLLGLKLKNSLSKICLRPGGHRLHLEDKNLSKIIEEFLSYI
jgi:pimeloyl-ACP methyl ester carboxylesterase